MKPKKLTQLITLGILITFITVLQPFLTLALNSAQIADIATQITVRITGADNGSGVIISKNGNTYTVLTNSHVFENPGNYQVTTPDTRKYQVTNIKRIEKLDLATFQFNSSQEYRVVELGDSNQMTIGKAVYISGFPADKGLNFREDKISRIEEPQNGGYTLVYRVGGFPGMSGGPILDEDGKLVGIHGLTRSVSLGPFQPSTPEEYGIPLQTFLNASSISRPSPNPSPSPTPISRPSPTPDAEAYNSRGNFYRNQQKWDLALADYTQAIRINPNYAEAYNNRGLVYEYQQKWDLALADYNNAIKLNPNYAEAYNNRGLVYLNLLDIKKARENFVRAAQLFLTQGNTADYQDVIRLLNSL